MRERQERSSMRRGRIIRLMLLAAFVTAVAGGQELACRTSESIPATLDFRGQTIRNGNFSYRDLTNANFSNTTLIAPYFAYANLTKANFEGAVFIDYNSNPSAVSDFSFANLQSACFLGARFESLTYFTGATLTCADFSKTDLSSKNAIFGESPLNFDRTRTDCRLAFRFSTMDCEFMSDWRFLDLGGAHIKACSSQLTGQDFSGAKLNSVNLSGENLDATKFVKANLNEAILDQASLRGADLSYATLLGAHLNHANLTGASLYHAFLSNDTPSGITNAASVRQSHLKNVNFSYALMSGVDFTYSNFYGDNPTVGGICKTAPSPSQCSQPGSPNYEGFTCGCASAHSAVMAQTKFAGGYLYGVDLTDAQGQGVDFQEAVLTGANLNGTSISSDSSGKASTLFRAFLQGTDLEGAHIKDRPTLANAFVDFTPFGNNIYILLNGANHNQFPCKDCTPPAGNDVCVLVNYGTATRVPSEVELTCPNGHIGDCGLPESNGSNPNWRSKIDDLGDPPTGIPPAWYETDSTYIKAPADSNSICKGQGPGAAILFW